MVGIIIYRLSHGPLESASSRSGLIILSSLFVRLDRFIRRPRQYRDQVLQRARRHLFLITLVSMTQDREFIDKAAQLHSFLRKPTNGLRNFKIVNSWTKPLNFTLSFDNRQTDCGISKLEIHPYGSISPGYTGKQWSGTAQRTMMGSPSTSTYCSPIQRNPQAMHVNGTLLRVLSTSETLIIYRHHLQNLIPS